MGQMGLTRLDRMSVAKRLSRRGSPMPCLLSSAAQNSVVLVITKQICTEPPQMQDFYDTKYK